MMNKLIAIMTIFLFAGCTPSKRESASSSAGINELPSFTITLSSGEKLLTHSLEGNVILIFYNPDCDHCQREGEDISRHLEAFRNHTLYFIATSSRESIAQFARNYHLESQPNVLFVQADGPEVIREMGAMKTPALFIYSREKQLLKKFDGETKVGEIVPFLTEIQGLRSR